MREIRLLVSAAVTFAICVTASPAWAADGPQTDSFNGVAPESASHSQPLSAAKIALAHNTLEAMASENARRQSLATSSAVAVPYSVTYNTLSITTEQQQGHEWCVPASTRAAVSAFTSSLPSQTTLATEEGTSDSSGTILSAAARALNRRETRNGYVYWTGATSASSLFAQVRTDVASYKAPSIPAMQAHELTLWEQNGYYGNHAIVLYGYGNDNSSLKYFDPLDASPMYGRHLTTSSTVFTGMKDLGAPAIVL